MPAPATPSHPIPPAASPLAWIGNYLSIDHEVTCPVGEVKTEMKKAVTNTGRGEIQTNEALKTLLNQKAPGICKPTHTMRLLCDCMSALDLDKHVCLEFMSRDLVIESYAHLTKMASVYSLKELMKDPDLRLIAINYLTLKQTYLLLQQSAPPTPKAVKSGAKPMPITKLDLPKLVNDEFCNVAESSDNFGSFGTTFDDVLKGKPIKVPKKKGIIMTAPWVPAAWESDIRVWYRIYEGGIDFRVEGTVPSTLHDIIAIASEVEMAKLWMPTIKVPKLGLSEATCLGRFGRFSKVSQYKVVLPYPLTNVEVIAQGYMIDDLERNNKLTICMASFDAQSSPAEKETWPIPIPPVAKGHQRVQFGGGCVFEPIGPNMIDMKTVWSIKMDEKPNSRLIDFVSSKFLKLAFGKFIGTTDKFSDRFAEAKRGDPWLYGHLEYRMDLLEEAGNDPLDASNSTKGFRNIRAESVYHQGQCDILLAGEFDSMTINNKKANIEEDNHPNSRRPLPDIAHTEPARSRAEPITRRNRALNKSKKFMRSSTAK